MTQPSRSRTNAADSAPGVGDGPVSGAAGPVDARPGGRGKLKWILLAAALILILGVFARGWTPGGSERTAVGTPASSDSPSAASAAATEDAPLAP